VIAVATGRVCRVAGRRGQLLIDAQLPSIRPRLAPRLGVGSEPVPTRFTSR
jgi:hypothetical protein